MKPSLTRVRAIGASTAASAEDRAGRRVNGCAAARVHVCRVGRRSDRKQCSRISVLRPVRPSVPPVHVHRGGPGHVSRHACHQRASGATRSPTSFHHPSNRPWPLRCRATWTTADRRALGLSVVVARDDGDVDGSWNLDVGACRKRPRHATGEAIVPLVCGGWPPPRGGGGGFLPPPWPA